MKASRPRGLCWTCFYAPGVRERFPSTSKFARRGLGHDGRDVPPPVATDAPPGTEQKIAVLEERARLAVSLWHPADRPMDPESKKLGMR